MVLAGMPSLEAKGLDDGDLGLLAVGESNRAAPFNLPIPDNASAYVYFIK